MSIREQGLKISLINVHYIVKYKFKLEILQIIKAKVTKGESIIIKKFRTLIILIQSS